MRRGRTQQLLHLLAWDVRETVTLVHTFEASLLTADVGRVFTVLGNDQFQLEPEEEHSFTPIQITFD